MHRCEPRHLPDQCRSAAKPIASDWTSSARADHGRLLWTAWDSGPSLPGTDQIDNLSCKPAIIEGGIEGMHLSPDIRDEPSNQCVPVALDRIIDWRIVDGGRDGQLHPAITLEVVVMQFRGTVAACQHKRPFHSVEGQGGVVPAFR